MDHGMVRTQNVVDNPLEGSCSHSPQSKQTMHYNCFIGSYNIVKFHSIVILMKLACTILKGLYTFMQKLLLGR